MRRIGVGKAFDDPETTDDLPSGSMVRPLLRYWRCGHDAGEQRPNKSRRSRAPALPLTAMMQPRNSVRSPASPQHPHAGSESLALDHTTLELLRKQHPAWRLLAADSAPLIASFLHQVFVLPNTRVMKQSQLAEALDDQLRVLRQQLGDNAYPKSAVEYLNDWAANERGWLRRFYAPDSDEPHYDLTPATERAIGWLVGLTERGFVGTQSRLLTLVDLLRQINRGSEADPKIRLSELHADRDAIDAEIARVMAGDITILDDTAVKDRFQQFSILARELLADFREVEQNFRKLDRSSRERITASDGARGALLADIMAERDLIVDSDQGKSFRAFWEFLMSSQRQDELSDLLDRVVQLAPVRTLKPDSRLRRVHYEWLVAAEHTQRTVAMLSQQLRRFLDDKARLENRRIMEILRSIEVRTLAMRTELPSGTFMEIADAACLIELPMERPLYSPPVRTRIETLRHDDTEDNVDVGALFAHVAVDRARLSRHIEHALQLRSQISLAELVVLHPLQQGLGELVAYLQLAESDSHATIDDMRTDTIVWRSSDDARTRSGQVSRVIFSRR